MRAVFTSVQPRTSDTAEHPRAGQAGHVCAVPDDPTKVRVRWNEQADPAQEAGLDRETVENIADLRALG